MVEKKESKGSGEELGLVGFTFGILSIILIGSNGIFIAVIGFIFSMIQQKRNPTKFGRIGIILNIIGFILAIILIIVLLVWVGPLLGDQISNFPIG